MYFTTGEKLLNICTKENISISEAMILREIKKFNSNKKTVIEEMEKTLNVMKDAIKNGIDHSKPSFTGLIGGEAKLLTKYMALNKTISGKNLLVNITNAMAVMEENSKMGKIVAAPTAGSCGIIPGALIATAERMDISDKKIINSLFTASAIGYLFMRNATVSGAEGGCQAETGTAAAMAAGALVELLDGSPSQVLSAASFTIKNVLGLVCDPVAGLVELPCAKRNALGVSNAMLCADMALAGIETKIPFDQVVETMYRVGKKMHPDLKETANGGIAITNAGKEFERKIFN